VSDLVVERLDSRLAVRERAFNLDGVAVKVVEGMAGTLEPLKMVTEAVEKMTISHQTLNTDTQDLLSSHKILTALISDLPTQLIEATEALRTTEAEIKEGRNRSEQMDAILKTISDISSALDGVHTGQKALKEQVVELSSLQEDVVSGLNALPEVLVATTKVLDDAHNDMMSRDSSYKRDFDEVRSILSTNTDLQVQLAKARGAHGQVRVEKDMLGERLHIVEEERDALRKQVEELQAAAAAHTNQVASAEIRNAELQQALESAQEHLKSSEITVSDHKIRQELLESENKALLAEQAKLKEQVCFPNRLNQYAC
jgi:chromosome segregation ATPase